MRHFQRFSTGLLALALPLMACSKENSSCVDAGSLDLDAGRPTFGEFNYCLSSADCMPPLECVSDPSESSLSRFCEFACQQTSDCRSPDSHCLNGRCAENRCSPFNSVCNVPTGGKGTCQQVGSAGQGYCFEGGTATSICDPAAGRGTPELLCVAGMFCFPVGDGGGLCGPACDPEAPETCPAGTGCAHDLALPPGACLPAGDGGCLYAFPASELHGCREATGCGCPSVCAADPIFGPVQSSEGTYVCELPCTTTADCQNPQTACIGGLCASNPCGNVLGACDAAGHGDGICLPAGGPAGGICLQGGSATYACDPIPIGDGFCTSAGYYDTCFTSASRSHPEGLCPVGSFCTLTHTCVRICSPGDGGGGCPVGSLCVPYDENSLAGCFPLGDAGCLENYVPPNTSVTAMGSLCACPRVSVQDPYLGQTCLWPCQSTSDCKASSEVCLGGFCRTDYCSIGPDGHPVGNGMLGGLCDSAGTGDGTCVPVSVTDSPVSLYGVCEQGGTATGSCEPYGSRDAPADLCPAGWLCLRSNDFNGPSRCVRLCGLQGPTCPAGYSCLPSGLGFGACVASDGGC